tara:strand:+ start:182 stop:706 length:525 start_codon:yes stop_codon:yes gene_type:complete
MGFFDFFKKSKNIENENGLNEFYYNYGKGKIRERYYKKEGKKEGVYSSYYENGQLLNEINYKNNKEYGLCKGYYNNGQLMWVRDYKNDKETEKRSYHRNGDLVILGNPLDGDDEDLKNIYMYQNWMMGKRLGIMMGEGFSSYAARFEPSFVIDYTILDYFGLNAIERYLKRKGH